MIFSRNSHILKIIGGLVVFAVAGFFGRNLFIPETFGRYGHYRAKAVKEEVMRPLRHMTNTSCVRCHEYEAGLHLQGLHKTISCEFCHGPLADHVRDGKKTGVLPVKKGEEIKTLCLRCHNRAIHARPKQVIKTVTMPEHLQKQKVRLTHICNQCHHVHAPLQYIKRAEEIVGLKEAS